MELKLHDGRKINIVVLKSVLMVLESVHVILKSVDVILKSVDVIAVRLVFHQFME